MSTLRLLSGAALVCAMLLVPVVAEAHCDTMDGPVVRDARAALAARDVTPTLKWVRHRDEQEIRDAFARTLAVRAQGDEARDLADRFFFETLVRIHRAGEGAPYSGLKPEGTDPGTPVRAADQALETGNADELIEHLTRATINGVREKFERARAAKRTAASSVEAGREYVEAYVQYVHYVERLHQNAVSPVEHHAEEHEEDRE